MLASVVNVADAGCVEVLGMFVLSADWSWSDLLWAWGTVDGPC